MRASQRVQLRDSLFPGAESEIFAPSVRTTVGFCRPPRVVSLVAGLADLERSKDAPGRLYLSLWTHDWGEGIVEADSTALVYEADPSLSALRVERHWKSKVKALVDLDLIRTSPRGHRDQGYVLLRDPHLVVLETRHKLEARDWWPKWWGAFEARCREVGVDLAAYQQRAKKEEKVAP